MIIDKPGLYKTRNGKRVTVHEIKYPPHHQEGNTCFPVRGSVWKRKDDIGMNPPFGIWQVNGDYTIFGPHGLDIVERIEK